MTVRTIASVRQRIRSMGTYLRFDGVDDLVTLDEIEYTASSKISAFAWIRILGTAANQTIVCKRNSGSAATFQFRVTPSKLDFTWTAATVFQSYNTTNPFVPQKVWTHVGFAFDFASPGSVDYFVNGVKTTESRVVGSGTTPDDTNCALTIGRRFDSAMPFNGDIDDVRIYSDKKTENDAVAIMTGRGDNLSNIVRFYKFDEGSGSTATDSTGTANGTITEAVYKTSDLPFSGSRASTVSV